VENLNVWKFVSEAVRPFTINAIKAQIMFSVDCVDMDLDWMQNFIIKADKFKLNQVLRNFVSNALKFCDPSNGEVRVVVERKAVPGNLVRPISSPSAEPIMVNNVVRVSVSDNGFGISEENQKKLFGKHVQFNAGQQQKGGGSGLGLWISKSKFPIVCVIITIHFSIQNPLLYALFNTFERKYDGSFVICDDIYLPM
jgi:signal transduction histidine kinase